MSIKKPGNSNALQVESLRVLPESPTRALVKWAQDELDNYLRTAALELEYEITAAQGGSTQEPRFPQAPQHRFHRSPKICKLFVAGILVYYYLYISRVHRAPA